MKNYTLIHSFLILLLFALFACGGGDEKAADTQQDEAIVVKMQPVTSEAIDLPIVVSGTVASKKEAKLSFKTGGILANIAAEEGQLVKKGQLLASLNLTEISAQVSQARNAQEKAQRDMDRVKRLYADSAATYEQVQNATTGFEVANSSLNIARFNQQYSTIYAPDNGRILRRFVEQGEIVGPGSPVFLFASSAEEQWIVRTGVADRDMVRIQLGDKATLHLDAFPGVDFSAAITEIAPTADPRSGTFEVELRIGAQGKKLASGMIAKTTIHPSKGPALPIVPIEALVEADGEQAYVYTLTSNGKTVQKMPVQVSTIFGNKVAIANGLKAGDSVVIEGASYLTSGTKVTVVK